MADTDTDTDTDTQIPNTAAAIADLQRQLAQPAPTIPTGSPNDGTSPSWTGLLGRVLGGAPAGYQLRGGEADAAGNRALLNFGINMLLASGPHTVRPNVLSSLATGLQGAQESVGQDQRSSAALAGAQYQAAREARQDQLARIKEAIPLLQLQVNQRAADAARRVMGGGTPGAAAPSTSIATGGSIAVPPELLPIYQEASARTGIPVDVLIAQGKQESGFNPNAVGDAGEIGLHQIKPSTAKDPGFGMTGIDPATLKDPRVNINFAADYLKARGGPRTDFSDPATVNAALKNYNGGGDPNYVANVNRYRPGALTAVTGAAAPPAALGGDPRAPIQMPPPVQVAGPGAGSAPSAPPPGPTTQAAAPPDVPWLPGQVGPATGPLAPAGQAAAPPATPPSVSPPPIVTPTPGATSQAPFNPADVAIRYGALPPDLTARPTITPEEDASIQRQIAIAMPQLDAAKQLAEVEKQRRDLISAKIEKQNADIQAWRANEAKTQVDEAAKQAAEVRANAAKAADAAQAQKYALETEAERARQARLSTEAGAVVESNKRVRDSLGDDATAAAKTVPNLEALRVLSDNVPDGSSDTLRKLATVQFGGTSLLNHLASLGLADPTKVGPIQQLQGAISGTVAQLRQGMSMGQLSDRDLSFIESLGPSLYEDQATRSAVISYLQQAARARMRFNTVYNEEMTRPGAYPAVALEKTRDIMEAKYPVVPQMTASVAAHWNDQTPEWKAERIRWAAAKGVKQHTLVRNPDGSLTLVK